MSVLNPIKEFFTGAAFRPHLLAERVPLARRAAGKRVLVASGFLGGVNTGGGPALTMVKVGVAEFPNVWTPGGQAKISDVEQVEWRNSDQQMAGLKELYARHGTNLVAWLMPDCIGSLSASVKAMPDGDLNQTCRENPSAIIGKKKEAGRIYCAVRHPKLQSGIIFSMPQPTLAAVADGIRASGGRLIRLQCGAPSILRCLVETAYDEIFADPVSSDVYILDHLATSLHLFIDSKDWLKVPSVRMETLTAADPMGTIKANLIRQLKERRNVPLLVVNTTTHQLRSLFQDPDLAGIKVRFYGEPEKGLPNYDFKALCYL